MVVNKEAVYPSPPFSPGERYPEYPFQSIAATPNHVYALVRDCLRRLGLDPEHFGSKSWNPLGGIVRPGDNVVIKPNWVYQKKQRQWIAGGGHNSPFRSPGSLGLYLDSIGRRRDGDRR